MLLRNFLLLFFFHLSITLHYGQNVKVNISGNPVEPSIIIDPKNPAVLIAGANINKYYLSTDTGHTWTQHSLASTYGVWGDPCLVVDTAQNFYYLHLSNPPGGNWIDRIVCQQTANNGLNWSPGTYTGLNGTKDQDKEWCVVDRRNNYLYVTWTEFDEYGSSQPGDSSRILFSKSTDLGNTWSNPLQLNHISGDCIDSDNTLEGATPAVGPNGEIYVSWAGPNGIMFNQSPDTGNTWLNHELLIDPMPGGWDHQISGIQRSNGLPVTACDLSNGAFHGNIYISWADQRNGIQNTDIWISKSEDGGQTWSQALMVNDDNNSSQQFFPWMAIDQTNGYIYIVFYDRREHAGDTTDVYLAISMDGGNTFINRKISDSPFLPNASVFFGDYTNITVHNNIVRPIWTRMHNGVLSIWTNVTPLPQILNPLPVSFTESDPYTFESFPNPAGEYIFVSFKLKQLANVVVTIYNALGQPVKDVIPLQEKAAGNYVERLDLSEMNISPGLYTLFLKTGDTSSYKKIIKR